MCWSGFGRALAEARPPKRASAPAIRVAAILGRRSLERPARRLPCTDWVSAPAAFLAMASAIATTVRDAAASSWGVGGCRTATRSAATAAYPGGASSGARTPDRSRSAVCSSSRCLPIPVLYRPGRRTRYSRLVEVSGQAIQGPVLQDPDRARLLPHHLSGLLGGETAHHSQKDHLGLVRREDLHQTLDGLLRRDRVDRLDLDVAGVGQLHQILDRHRLGATPRVPA